MSFPSSILRRASAGLLAVGLAVMASSHALAQERLSVVASFTILGDLIQAIGGDRVEVTTLVGPGADSHGFVPTPADARAVAEADIVVVNGLGFEGWLTRLTDAAGFGGPIVVATDGVQPLEAAHEDEHGSVDPHAWQNAANVEIYVGNIAAALTAADPGGAAYYQERLAGYRNELAALDSDIRNAVAALPPNRRAAVTSHDAFGYFSASYGITFLAPQGINPEAEAAAGDVAALIRQITDNDIGAVFIETINDPRLIEQIARETGATIGGTLYSDTLSEPGGPAATYLEMMRYNTDAIVTALGPVTQLR